MSRIRRSPGLTRLLVLAMAGLGVVGFSSSLVPACRAASFATQDYGGQDPDGLGMPNLGPFPGEDDGMPRRPRAKAARKKLRPTEQANTTKKGDATGKAAKSAPKGKAGGSDRLSFSQDVAPILVANCMRCHSGDGVGVKKGKLDLSTFERLMKGTGAPDRTVVSPGQPDESSLVLRVKGQETPRMPQGANQVLSADAIAKIEKWVKQGAKLDKGLDPKKNVETYAASAEQVRRAQVSRQPQEQVDKTVEATGTQRWKQANPKLKPDVVSGDHFVMFSTLPRERAQTTLKAMETQYLHLKKILGTHGTAWVEKVSLYVFPARKDYIEFVRSVESRPDIEADEMASGRLGVAQPYVAVVDPQGGRRDEPGASKRKGRGRRGEEASGDGGSDRTLNGLLAEHLGTAALSAAGTPPRWLALGVGSYLAAQVEPRGAHQNQLRHTALAAFQQGWPTKANEALGGSDQISSDSLHAVGFALVEAMMSIEVNRRYFPAFVAGLLEGGDKLDETLQNVFHGTREEFINDTGEWIAARYGQLQ